MKKNIGIFISLVIIVVIIITLNENSKMIIVENRDNIGGLSVNGVSYNDAIVADEIIDILMKYETKKTKNTFPRQTSSTKINIDYDEGYKPRHILLDDINVIYESADQSIYEISDGDLLREEIEKVLGNEKNKKN